MMRLVSLIVHVDSDYYYVRTVNHEEKEKRKEKQREKKGNTSSQFVKTKPVMGSIFWVTYIWFFFQWMKFRVIKKCSS